VEALLDQEHSQTEQEKLVESLNVNQRFPDVESHWNDSKARKLPYELKPKDIERRKITCELLFQRHRRKSFLHRIVTDDKKWIRYNNPKRKK